MSQDIKEAFSRVKEDMFFLAEEMQKIKSEFSLVSSSFLSLNELLVQLKQEIKLLRNSLNSVNFSETNSSSNPTHNPTHPAENPTIQQITPTHFSIPTDNIALYSPISKDKASSTGNEGVPTDRQTNQQTNQHIIQHIPNEEKLPSQESLNSKTSQGDHFAKVSEILGSLDSLKKEIRLKFKRLTSQEMAVFSLLYSLEEQGELVDYKILSSNLHLSESSIRDYIQKIISKGVPITKEKVNNKRILLHISQDMKQLASLNTIIQLREL